MHPVNVSMRLVSIHWQRRSEFHGRESLLKLTRCGTAQYHYALNTVHGNIGTSGSFITFPQEVKEAATPMQVIK